MTSPLQYRNARIYAQCLVQQVQGHALWSPSDSLVVGDCGFLEGGEFQVLHNVLSELGIDEQKDVKTKLVANNPFYASEKLSLKVNASATSPTAVELEGNVTLSSQLQSAAFLWLGSEDTHHLYRKIGPSRRLEYYLTDNISEIIKKYGKDYRFKRNDICIIRSTKEACSWRGGVAHSQGSEMSVGFKITNVVAAGFERVHEHSSGVIANHPLSNSASNLGAFSHTSGPAVLWSKVHNCLISPNGLEADTCLKHCVAVELIQISFRGGLISRLLELIRILHADKDGASSRTDKSVPAKDTNVQSSTSSSVQTAGSSRMTTSLRLGDNVEYDERTLLQAFIDTILKTMPEVDMVVAEHATVLALAEKHHITRSSQIQAKYHAMRNDIILCTWRTANGELVVCPELGTGDVEAIERPDEGTLDELNSAMRSLVSARKLHPDDGWGFEKLDTQAQQGKMISLLFSVLEDTGVELIAKYLAAISLEYLSHLWVESFENRPIIWLVSHIASRYTYNSQEFDEISSVEELPTFILERISYLAENRISPAAGLLQKLERVVPLSDENEGNDEDLLSIGLRRRLNIDIIKEARPKSKAHNYPSRSSSNAIFPQKQTSRRSAPAIITLYDSPRGENDHRSWMPDSWKVRFTLNYKRLEYRTIWVKSQDIDKTLREIGAPPTTHSRNGNPPVYTLPVLVDPTRDPDKPIILSDANTIAGYLEQKYPARPVFPEGSQALQISRVHSIEELISNPLRSVLIDPERYNEPLPLPLETWKEEQEWAVVRSQFDHMADILDMNGDGDGILAEGLEVTYADFALCANLIWIERASTGDRWAAVRAWNDGRWDRLWKRCREYMDEM